MPTSCNAAAAPDARAPGGPRCRAAAPNLYPGEPGAMTCPRCDVALETALPERQDALCPQCGTLLVPAGLARRLLAKMTQLARFGLADPGDPILKRSDPSEGKA